MSDEWEALGPAYGRLGIATSSEIIAARKVAAQAGYEAFATSHLAGALRTAFGLGDATQTKLLFDKMRASDPTLDLEPTDLEAQLLIGAVLQAEMKAATVLGGLTALGIVTTSFGGVRQSTVMPDLVQTAEQLLANAQFASGGKPKQLIAAKRPDSVTAAIDAIGAINTNYGQGIAAPTAIAAIKAVAEYVDTAHVAAATQANAAMIYTRQLEEELRTYWWVVGGWSDQRRKPFKDLGQNEASLRAGAELSDKTTLPLGLFAAPALIDKVLRHERKGKLIKPALAEAVKSVDAGWRARFKTAADHGELFPVSLALYSSAESGDAEDWQPRFKRVTKINPQITMGALDLALQLYREIVLARALAKAT